MKIFIILLAPLVIIFSSRADEIKAWEPYSNNKMLSGVTAGNWCGIYIIEYEGTKYIVNAAGGIIKVEPPKPVEPKPIFVPYKMFGELDGK